MDGFTFKGEHSSKYNLVIQNTPVILPTITNNTQEVPGRPGAYFFENKRGPRPISVPFGFKSVDTADYYNQILQLAYWLLSDQPEPLIFDQLPNITFYATLSGDTQLNRIINTLAQGTIPFVCPDPIGYGAEHSQTLAVPPATFSRSSIAYDENGVQVSADIPRFKALGKNFLPPFKYWTNGLFTGGFKYDNITYTSEYEATIQSKGGAMLTYDVELAAGQTYSMSVGSGSQGSLYLYKNHNATAIYSGSEDYTFTADETAIYTFGLYLSNSEDQATFIEPQLEEGTTASPFEEMISGIMVEEGTTNLIDPNPANWSSYGGATKTVSADASLPEASTNNAYRVQTSGGTSDTKLFVSGGQSVNGSTYSYFIHVKNNHATDTLTVHPNLSGGTAPVTLNPGEYQFITFTEPGGTSNAEFVIKAQSSSGTIDCVIYQPQIEQKAYATSFINGTRSPETLTLPSEVLNRDEGTFETEIYVEDAASFSQGNYYMFDSRPNGTNNEKRFLIYLVSQQVKFLIGDNGSSFTVVNVPASNLVDGPNLISCRWGKEGRKLEVNGVGAVSSESIQLPDIDPILYLGCSSTNTFYANQYLSNLRISNKYRDDSEIGNWEVDEYTTALMDFYNNLVTQAPTTLSNVGTAESFPVFTAAVKNPITMLQLVSPIDYMQVGQPVNVENTSVDPYTTILKDDCSSLTNWTPSADGSTIEDGIVGGSMGVRGGYSFTPDSYGSNPNGWVGPAVKKALSEPLQDFEATFEISNYNQWGAVGRVSIYLLDNLDNVVSKLEMSDSSNLQELNYGVVRIGDSSKYEMLIDYAGDVPGAWNGFRGILRLIRKGNAFYAYIAKVNQETGEHYARHNSRPFIDSENIYQTPISQVLVYIASARGYTTFLHELHDVSILKINDPAANQIPYIANAGDILTFDHQYKKILKNGEPYMTEKDFPSRFFSIGPGDTELGIYPPDAAVVQATWKDAYL